MIAAVQDYSPVWEFVYIDPALIESGQVLVDDASNLRWNLEDFVFTE